MSVLYSLKHRFIVGSILSSISASQMLVYMFPAPKQHLRGGDIFETLDDMDKAMTGWLDTTDFWGQGTENRRTRLTVQYMSQLAWVICGGFHGVQDSSRGLVGCDDV